MDKRLSLFYFFYFFSCEFKFKNPPINVRSVGNFFKLCYYYGVVGGGNDDRNHNYGRNF